MTSVHSPSAPAGHTFFIPVMGIGFTIDSPLKVARYGITSVISLVDDRFIERVRRYHCERVGEPYHPIASGEEDARARRITAYLDLLDRLVARDTAALRSSPFEEISSLGALEAPTLVVGSRDDLDSGHPLAVAELWAETIPGARLVVEEPGDSPLAWQGGRLSRVIDEFLDLRPG